MSNRTAVAVSCGVSGRCCRSVAYGRAQAHRHALWARSAKRVKRGGSAKGRRRSRSSRWEGAERRETDEQRRNRCDDNECQQGPRDSGHGRHRRLGGQQITVVTCSKAVIACVVVGTVTGKRCGAQRRFGLLLAMRDDQLTDQRRKHDQTHGDQAKPCGREGAGASSHVGREEVVGSLTLRNIAFQLESYGMVAARRALRRHARRVRAQGPCSRCYCPAAFFTAHCDWRLSPSLNLKVTGIVVPTVSGFLASSNIT